MQVACAHHVDRDAGRDREGVDMRVDTDVLMGVDGHHRHRRG